VRGVLIGGKTFYGVTLYLDARKRTFSVSGLFPAPDPPD